MMNRSSNPVDPYVPSIMSFVGLDGNTTVPTQKSHLWDWETNNHAQNHSHPIPTTNSTPFFEPPPSLFPINNFPLYSSPFAAEYPAGIIKREEGGGGRIGLNLGHRTYFSSGDALTLDRLFAARAQHHQQPRCQVEGCKADLSGAKHYHRRHKVCEFHSKAIVVIAGGTQQRFCQQCSRFHVLAEFDEAKRSCRKRLADHNRRRRKPQNPSTNSAEKTKHTPKPSRDICTTSKSTTTTPAISTANSGFEGEHGNLQNRNIILRNEPALSLGGVGGSHHSLYQHFSSPSTNNFFYHQSLIGSSSNEASQSTEGGSDHHHQSNLLHLGQAMFEVDFM